MTCIHNWLKIEEEIISSLILLLNNNKNLPAIIFRVKKIKQLAKLILKKRMKEGSFCKVKRKVNLNQGM